MVDYFDANAANGTTSGVDGAATTNGTVQPAATNGGEDLGMDEISVGTNYNLTCFFPLTFTPLVNDCVCASSRDWGTAAHGLVVESSAFG